jgi:pilus assembly protein CpaE
LEIGQQGWGVLMKGPADFELAQIAPVPRISLQAFCESPETARIIQAAATDRRMERAHVSVHLGGALAAIEAYRDAPTPNVIVLDSAAGRGELVSHIDALAEFCDSGTKVVVAGRTNDILLYRELITRGISEYLVAPFDVLEFIRARRFLKSHTSGRASRVLLEWSPKPATRALQSRQLLQWLQSRSAFRPFRAPRRRRNRPRSRSVPTTITSPKA